jgi:hypothetical protein
MNVFVVVSERGEWSDRETWVSGVFSTRSDAEKSINDRLSISREHEQWSQRKSQSMRKLYDDLAHTQHALDAASTSDRAAFEKANGIQPRRIRMDRLVLQPSDEDLKSAASMAGVEPEYESAERSQIFEIEMGQWIQNGDTVVFAKGYHD